MKHTPTPWKLESYLVGQIVNEDESKMIARAGRVNSYESDPDQIERKANAAFIVRAVNSHQQLVEAIKGLMEYASLIEERFDSVATNEARAALAAAGAK